MNAKKTVETWIKGIKATKADALECQTETSGTSQTEHYKAAYQRLVAAYKAAYPTFTTDVKKQADTEIAKAVYDCFGATRKQIEALFPEREKRKSINVFNLDKLVENTIKTMKEKGCLAEGIVAFSAAFNNIKNDI